MAISDFQNCGFLIPKNNKFRFFKNKCPKIQNFIDIQKNGVYVIELCVTNGCTKCQASIFIFGCEMVQKPIDGTVIIFFETRFLEFPNAVRQNK